MPNAESGVTPAREPGRWETAEREWWYCACGDINAPTVAECIRCGNVQPPRPPMPEAEPPTIKSVADEMRERGWDLGSFDAIAAELERLCGIARVAGALEAIAAFNRAASPTGEGAPDGELRERVIALLRAAHTSTRASTFYELAETLGLAYPATEFQIADALLAAGSRPTGEGAEREVDEVIALRSLHVEAERGKPWTARAGFDGPAAEMFAAALCDFYRKSGGENYVEMHMRDPNSPTEEFVVTVQRKAGKTPHELRREAEEALAALRPSRPAPRETPDWEGFVREMFDAPDRGDWDGGEIQEVAVKHGVLREVTVTEPCDPEHCACAEVDAFPLTCYRLAPKSASLRASNGGAET